MQNIQFYNRINIKKTTTERIYIFIDKYCNFIENLFIIVFLEKIFNNYESIFDERYPKYQEKLLIFINFYYKYFEILIENIIFEGILYYNDYVLILYRTARFTTIPLNKLWIIGWMKTTFSLGRKKEPLDEEGNHYITALVGGGKSSLMKAKMDDYAAMTGKASYVTTRMEKPKFDGSQWYVNHRFFNFEEFFGGGKQIKKFNTNLFCAVIFDEMHLKNNQRNNKKTEYNEIFIPIVNSSIRMRHDGIKWMLFSSQMPKNDIQLMSLIKYYHKVKVIKGIRYWDWILTGEFKYTILGWKIQTFTVEANDSGLNLKKHKTWYKKCYQSYLDDFETLAMKDDNNKLPMDLDWISWRKGQAIKNANNIRN